MHKRSECRKLASISFGMVAWGRAKNKYPSTEHDCPGPGTEQIKEAHPDAAPSVNTRADNDSCSSIGKEARGQGAELLTKEVVSITCAPIGNVEIKKSSFPSFASAVRLIFKH